MEIAVLADIHSNYVALETCMRFALKRGIRKFLFLGDYIGEMAYPERTMELLKEYREEYDCTFIRGNKEDYWLSYAKGGECGWREYDSTTGALYYAYHRLTRRELDFFGEMPIAMKLQYGAMPTLQLCHGSPDKVSEALTPGSGRVERLLEATEVGLILCGHTHRQGKQEYRGKLLLNPGSVGLSIGGQGKAQFLILHGDEETRTWREEFISLDYDRERVIRELSVSGLMERAPYWCKVTEMQLAARGRYASADYGHSNVLFRAMELCREAVGECNWPDIPERYWEMAYRESCG